MAEEGANSSSSDVCPPQYLDITEERRLAYHKLEGSAPGVVFIHGLKSDMNGLKVLALEQVCKRLGKAYVRFDLSGHGQSSLDFSMCNITMWLEDLISVLSSLTTGPQILVGSSMGAWLMFLYTMRNPDEVAGMIGVGAAPDFTQAHWNSLNKEEKQEVKKTGVYKLASPYGNYELTLQLIQDGDKYSILDMPGERDGGEGDPKKGGGGDPKKEGEERGSLLYASRDLQAVLFRPTWCLCTHLLLCL